MVRGILDSTCLNSAPKPGSRLHSQVWYSGGRLVSDLTQMFGTLASRLISNVIRDSKFLLPSSAPKPSFKCLVL